MGEILKQSESGDRPEQRTENEEEPVPRLQFRLSSIDFVSPLGVFRAREGRPAEVAPNTSEVWREWRAELERRIARTAVKADQLFAELAH